MDQTITNNTCKGKCSCCGECCGPFLPLTYEEIKKIKKAIKDHDIKFDIKDFVTSKNVIFQCPFLDMKSRLCKLHKIDPELKPEVCKKFICSNNDIIINKNRTYYDKRAEVNGDSGTFHPMDLIFYDSPAFILLYIVNVLHIKDQDKMLHFLRRTGNKDIADAILDGRIKLEWSEK